MDSAKTGSEAPVVIIGAGFAGLTVARRLGEAKVAAVLVDRQNHHVFAPLLYQVATAGLSSAEIAAPIRAIVRHLPSISVLMDEVVDIDRAARCVVMASGTRLRYSTLVVASGARHAYFRNPEWAAHAPGIKTIDDAVRVRRDFPHITRKCVRVLLVDSGDRVLKHLPPALSAAAARALAGLGVEVRSNARVTGVTAGRIMIGEESLASAVTVWAAGVAASPAAAWLGVVGDAAGRVPVGADLALAEAPEIFVIGDTAAVTGSDGTMVPGVATAAKQMGTHVAATILGRRTGRTVAAFRYRDPGSMATIGRSRAVAAIGRIRLSDHLAWLLWCVVHIWYLAGYRNRLAVGVNWLWRYFTFDSAARLITQRDPTSTMGGTP